MLPKLAITMGDPAGVGPEVVVGALAVPAVAAVCQPVVVGDLDTLRRAARIVGISAELRPLAEVEDTASHPGIIAVLQPPRLEVTRVHQGQVSAAAGRAAHDCIVEATRLALAGEMDAVVTAPIHKESLRASGCPHPGHTELLASLTGALQVAMMLVAGSLRVSHVTTHLALRQACERVRQERVLQVIRLTHQAVVRMGVRRPHIAVAGLNPHAGEGGLFGREEIDEISPAIRSAQAEGIDAAGPYPPDTVFYLATQAAGPGRPPMDAVVAMVHDHGHIAVKLMGFMEGVNLTLGLPIIRTSPDHGTAFDKAGKGTADPSSMVQAILLAARMAKGQRER